MEHHKNLWTILNVNFIWKMRCENVVNAWTLLKKKEIRAFLPYANSSLTNWLVPSNRYHRSNNCESVQNVVRKSLDIGSKEGTSPHLDPGSGTRLTQLSACVVRDSWSMKTLEHFAIDFNISITAGCYTTWKTMLPGVARKGGRSVPTPCRTNRLNNLQDMAS